MRRISVELCANCEDQKAHTYELEFNEIQKAICGEITEQIVLHQANNDANQRSKHRFLFQRN